MIAERGQRVVIVPGSRVGFSHWVATSPSFGWRAIVLGRFAQSALLVVIVERHGRAIVDRASLVLAVQDEVRR